MNIFVFRAWLCVAVVALLAPGCDSADLANSAGGEVASAELVEPSDEEIDESSASSNASDGLPAEVESSEVVEEPVEEIVEAPAFPFLPLSEAGDVVSFVEVDRYMGLWYELATTPSFQQGSCYSTQAQYSFNEVKGWVDVVNSCRIGSTSGNLQQIAGRAELVDLETQAKLNVIFFGQISPYWVVALDGTEGDEPYQWAVVSVPGKQSMWLLSRTRAMDPELRATIEDHLIERGFPVDTLIDTPHAK